MQHDEYVLRTLGPGDRAACERHLLALDIAARWYRFAHPATDGYIRAHCRAIAWECDRLTGAVSGDELVGLAALYRLPGGPPVTAELGLSVDARHRRRGIGAALVSRALLGARNRWTSRVYMHCQRDNRAMRRLATQLGAVVEDDGADATGAVRLLWPTCFSLMAELAG